MSGERGAACTGRWRRRLAGADEGTKAEGACLGEVALRQSGELGTFPQKKPQRPVSVKLLGQDASGEATALETRRRAGPRPAEQPAPAPAGPRRTAVLHGSSNRNAHDFYLSDCSEKTYPSMFKKWLLGFLKNWSMSLGGETEMANPPCPSLERKEAVFSASGSLQVPRTWTGPAVERASHGSPGPRSLRVPTRGAWRGPTRAVVPSPVSSECPSFFPHSRWPGRVGARAGRGPRTRAGALKYILTQYNK